MACGRRRRSPTRFQYRVISDRIGTHTLNTLLIRPGPAARSQLRAIVGVQAEPASAIRVGAMFRTRGIQFGQGGEVTLDSTLDGSTLSIGASIFDPSAQFSYTLPFETAGGIAFVAKRAELEFDIQGYSSIAPHALLSSSEPITIYRDPGNGAPTTEQRPFPPMMTASRGIANFRGRPYADRSVDHAAWHHHPRRSPVAPEDQVFDRWTVVWTVGAAATSEQRSHRRPKVSDPHNIILRNLLSEPFSDLGQVIRLTLRSTQVLTTHQAVAAVHRFEDRFFAGIPRGAQFTKASFDDGFSHATVLKLHQIDGGVTWIPTRSSRGSHPKEAE
jgi:hypothetical protein